MKKLFIFGAIICLIIFIILINFITLHNPKICYQKTCFNIKLAKTPAERQKGLMFIKYLPQNQGMLFVFTKIGNYGFWMKNTYIPLDIIWLDENRKVTKIWTGAKPCLDKKCPIVSGTGKYVLEVNSGIVKKLNIKIGDFLYFYP